MKEKKIYTALNALNVYELNAFKKYVLSPYFNVNESIIKYTLYLESKIKTNTLDSDISNESLWKEIFDTEAYDEQRFRKLNSDLVKLFESFMAQQEFEKMYSLKVNLKLEGLRNKGIDRLYNGVIGEIERLRKLEMNKSAEFYYNKYQIEKNLFNLTTESEKKTKKIDIENELNINEISKNLDYFYIAEKLRYYCTLLSWQKMYNIKNEMLNMDFIFEKTKDAAYLEIPPIAIYNVIKDTYINEDEIFYYNELRKLIKAYIHLFPSEEAKEIYLTAISYCVNKVNKNVLEFQSEMFTLYKEAIENRILIHDNNLSHSDFRNIAGIAVRVQEFSWAEYFINEYAGYVEEKYRDNAVYFSMARLDIYRKNYRKVIEHLHKVNYEDVWYNLGSKILLISSYYELEEFDALDSLLQAFRMYIDREKSLSKERKQTYINFINFTKKLIRLNPQDQEKLQLLKESIIATKGVVSKQWLLEKIAELEK